MAVTYTSNLKLGLPTTGTEPGAWGNVVNDQITTLVDQSISGTVSLTSMTNADYTLTNGNGNAANEARYMAILVPSSLTLTAARNIIVPSTSKMYIVKNATTGGFSVTVKTSGGTGIEVPNGNTMLLYCDGFNVVVAFDTINVNSQNGGQLAGLRNRIINGSMTIAQRGTSFAAIANAEYSLDRYKTEYVTSAVTTVSQQADVPSSNEFQNSLRVAVTTADASIAAGDVYLITQVIEGYNVRDLIGRTFTLSFWVRSSKTGVHCVALVNDSSDRSYVVQYTINAANTWESKTVTVSGGLITAGTWNWTNGLGLKVRFALAVGATFQTTANAWQTGNFSATSAQVNCLDTIGNIFAITGVQLEPGSVATTFEQRPIGMELALCQRYYVRVGPGFGTGFTWPAISGFADNATSAQFVMPFPAPMRIAPASLEQSGTAANYAVRYATGSATDCSAVPTFGNATVYGALFVLTVAAGLTAGQAIVARTGSASGNSAYLGWSAEL
jgi:hypothetical protein